MALFCINYDNNSIINMEVLKEIRKTDNSILALDGNELDFEDIDKSKFELNIIEV